MRHFSQLRRVGLADAMTIANGVCGFAAIALLLNAPPSERWTGSMVDGGLGIVVALLICGLTLDALDGAVARRFGASGLGDHLDPISDAIMFGVLPALLLIQSPAAAGAVGSLLAPLVGGVYFVAVVVRLATNATADDHEHSFTGLPSPAGAIASLALLALAPPPGLLFAGMTAVAALMVSSQRCPHPSALGVVLLSSIGCACGGGAFAGWISLELGAAFVCGCMFLTRPLERGARNVLALAAQMPRREQHA